MKSYLSLILLLLALCGCSTDELKMENYKVGRPSAFAINMMGKDHDFIAFADDLLYAIGAEEKFTIELYSSSTNGLMQGLKNKEYDAIVTFELPTTANIEKYEFSDIFFELGPVLILPEGKDFESFKALKEKIIGIQSEASLNFAKLKIPNLIFKPYDNMLFALENLVGGQIDGVVMDEFPAYAYARSLYKGKIRVASAPLAHDGFRMITLLNLQDQDFIDRFNRGLKKLKENGKYNELLTKWDLFNPEFDVVRIHLPDEATGSSTTPK